MLKTVRTCDFCKNEIGPEAKTGYMMCEEVRYINEPFDLYLQKNSETLNNDKEICMECWQKMLKGKFNLEDFKRFVEGKIDMQDLYLPEHFFMLLDEYLDMRGANGKVDS